MQATRSPNHFAPSRQRGALQGSLHSIAGDPLACISASDVERLAQACLRDQATVMAVIESFMTRGVPLEVIYLRGIASACNTFGQWWLDDHVDFATITLATCRLQKVLYELSPVFLESANENSNGLSALFIRTQASQHSIGAFMLGEFFKRSGWSVTDCILTSDSQIQWMLRSNWVDLVGYSLCTNRCIEQARLLLPNIRRHSANPRVQCMVGGPLASEKASILTEIGADFVGGDARQSQRLALQYVTSQVCKN